jgi:hypothetical protein
MKSTPTTTKPADGTQSAVSWADSTPAQRSHSGSGEGWCLFASVVGVFVLLGVFVAQIFASN